MKGLCFIAVVFPEDFFWESGESVQLACLAYLSSVNLILVCLLCLSVNNNIFNLTKKAWFCVWPSHWDFQKTISINLGIIWQTSTSCHLRKFEAWTPLWSRPERATGLWSMESWEKEGWTGGAEENNTAAGRRQFNNLANNIKSLQNILTTSELQRDCQKIPYLGYFLKKNCVQHFLFLFSMTI